jgi:hypothetical protein
MGSKIIPRRPGREPPPTFLRGEPLLSFADEINRAVQRLPVDDDLDSISISHTPDWASGQSFRRDVADACSGRHTAKACVCKNGDMFAEWKVFRAAVI